MAASQQRKSGWCKPFLFALALCAASYGSLPSQQPSTRSRAQVRDSVYALNAAKTALRVFHARFRELIDPEVPPPAKPWIQPVEFDCEMIVGPYCFGPGNGGIAFGARLSSYPVEYRTAELMVPRFLRRAVAREVERLLSVLESSQKRIPADRWIVGQRVFQLVQHGDIWPALEVARGCKAEAWWCASLVGYTSYLLNDQARADSAFAIALDHLAPQERCRWEGIDDLVQEDAHREWYSRLTCAEQADANRVLWWLADPLYLTPGNERFAAHYYREVFTQVFFDSVRELPEVVGCTFCPDVRRPTGPAARRGGLGIRLVAGSIYERELWQEDYFSSLVRGLGVPTYLMIGGDVSPASGGDVSPASGGPPQLLLQYQQPTHHFIPALSAVQNPLRAKDSDWDLHDIRVSERFHPGFGIFETLDYQMAFFRRGREARIITSTNLANNALTLRVGERLTTSALILTRNPDDIRVFRGSVPGTNKVFDTRAPAESTLVSIEVLAVGVGAARVRFASGPPPMKEQRVTASDILLMGSGTASSLESAAFAALPTTTVDRAAPLGLFWEVYGLQSGDSVTYSVSILEQGRSTLTNIGRTLGLVSENRTSSVTWSDSSGERDPIAPRSIVVDISTLSRGLHTIRLDIIVPGQDTLRVTRSVRVGG